MPIDLADFLEAKFALDERSLDTKVRGAFLQTLRALPRVRCLDVGTGTGAGVRRLLRAQLPPPLVITALDRDPDLLAINRREVQAWLRAAGDPPRIEGDTIGTQDGKTQIGFVRCELHDFRSPHRYDAITAHAFLDIVVLPQALAQFAALLEPGGCLYASGNYDGETAFRPLYADAGFEAELLAHYDDTMERRRVNGAATGGAYSGRRLEVLLPQHGFDIVRSGRSDWHIHALAGAYPDHDATCLQTILQLVRDEALDADRFDPAGIALWHAERMRLLRQARLELRIRQADVLARYRPVATAIP